MRVFLDVFHSALSTRCLICFLVMQCFTDRCSSTADTGIAAATARCSTRVPTFCLPRCCWACSGWRLRGCCRWPTTPCWRTCSRPGRWPTPKRAKASLGWLLAAAALVTCGNLCPSLHSGSPCLNSIEISYYFLLFKFSHPNQLYLGYTTTLSG